MSITTGGLYYPEFLFRLSLYYYSMSTIRNSFIISSSAKSQIKRFINYSPLKPFRRLPNFSPMKYKIL